MKQTIQLKRILAHLLVFAMTVTTTAFIGGQQAQVNAAPPPIPIAVDTGSTLTDFTNTLGDDDADTLFLATTQYNNYAPLDSPARTIQNNAVVAAGKLQLTNNTLWQVGTIVRRSPIKLNGGFSTYFKFDINNYSGDTADGLSFILYDASGGVKMGAPGGCLGLNDINGASRKYTSTGGSGGTPLPEFDNSIAVEFDTYQNAVDAQHDNFEQAVAIDVDGSSTHSSGLTDAAISSPIDDGTSAIDHQFNSIYDTSAGSNPMHVWVDYTENTIDPESYPGNTGIVTVTYGLSETRDDAGNRTIVRHVSSDLLNSDVYVGFTASTGGAGEYHQILAWDFSNEPVHDGIVPGSYTQAASGITVDTQNASGTSVTTNPTHAILQLKDGVGSDLSSAQGVDISIDAASPSEITTSGATTASGELDYTLPSLSPGSHTITAVTDDGSAQSTATFTVEAPLTSVAISGTAKIGRTLSATLAPSGATVTYQWYSSGSAVSTASTYTLTSADEGKTITVEATGTGYYTGTVTSAATAAVTAASSGSHGSGDTVNQPIAEVNGQPTVSGEVDETTSDDGKTTTKIIVNQTSLENQLEDKEDGATVTIPFTQSTDIAVGELNGQMVKDMEGKEATLVIETPTTSYTLPAEEINIDAISASLGSDLALSDIKVQIAIAAPSDATVQVVQQAASNGDLTLVVPAVNFEISCTYNSQTVNVSKFNAFVERRIAIPAGVDPQKITTGIVVDPDGKTRHVPTKIIVENGVYYAVINSLTNSTYSVVWHPFEFADVASCWAKDSINNMGSRMVVNGVDGSNYEPNRNMTRSEFAAIVVKALGLVPGDGSKTFGDVNASEWYSDYIKTAAAYGVISGYSDGNFGPNDTITREQAMAMVARAMSLTSLKDTADEASVLAKFTDNGEISGYANSSIAKCISAGVVNGKTEATVAPKAEITRAEVAAIVERLLKKSDLID